MCASNLHFSSVFWLIVSSTGQPPTCNCTAINSTKTNITCRLTYADSSYNPINAKMTWTSDGNFYKNDTPVRTVTAGYFTSTSTIIVDSNSTAIYQCNVTFPKPTPNVAIVATNAPEFLASCTSTCE